MYSNSQNDFKREVELKVFSELSKLSHQVSIFFIQNSLAKPGRPWISCSSGSMIYVELTINLLVYSGECKKSTQEVHRKTHSLVVQCLNM